MLCIFFDLSNARFHALRQRGEVLVAPVRQLVNQPIQWAHRAVQALSLQSELVEENNRLRMKEILLQSKIQHMLELQRENRQLKALLLSPVNTTGRVEVAQLLAVSLDPSLHQLILDRGEHDHVFIGQPVLDADGVMGQVVDVAPDTSKVLLVTDARAAVPVQDYRTGIRAIASGMGNNHQLQLLDVSPLADIKQGDLFVTSGFGQRFPSGYPVGVVQQVTHQSSDKFLTVTLLPTAHLDQTQRVLLIWPSQLKLHDQVEKLLSKPLPAPGEVKK